jgi:hypothetical protein
LTTTDTARELAPVITYRNLAGAPVIVHDMTTAPADPDLRGHHFNATCGGCLSECRVMHPYTDLREGREWASKHASTCRALPQITTASEAQREAYATLAAENASRAARLLEGETAVDGRTAGRVEARNPIECAQIYATVAETYARLAGGTGAGQ